MNQSDNYELNLVEGSDTFNPLVSDVPNFEKIDEIMKANEVAGIGTATELLSGSVHALTRANGDQAMFRFVATAAFTSGDSFTVDGVTVTGLLPTGQTPGTGAYVIGANVLCCLVGTTLTLYVPSGTVATAEDSNKLGGHTPDYYATAEDLDDVNDLASGAATSALTAITALNSKKLWTGTQLQYEAIAVKDANTLYFIVGE